jgi:outer membrane protein
MRCCFRSLLLCAALCAPAAYGQSLLAMYEAARGHDAAWQIAKAQYDATLFRAEQSKAGLLPNVGFTASASHSRFNGNLSEAGKANGQSLGLNASQPLYRPANLAEYEQGRGLAESAGVQLEAAEQDLMMRVAQAYFDVLAAAEALASLKSQEAAVAEQLAAAKNNFELGTATVTDEREAQARYDMVIAQQIAAGNDLEIKQLALDDLVGQQGVRPSAVVVMPLLRRPELADWLRDIERTNPQILQARINIERAKLEVKKAEAGHKPTVDLTASYSSARDQNQQLGSGLNSRTRSSSFGVAINWPLFAGFATQNLVRENLALVDKSNAELDAARRATAQAVRTAFLDVVSSQSQVLALEAAERSAQEALEANRLGYEVGIRINVDVLNAQSLLFQAQRDLSQARHRVLLAHIRLRQAAGILVAADLARVNAPP